MQQPTLDYQSSRHRGRAATTRAMMPVIGVAIAVLIANAILIALEASDPGFGALGVALIAGPIANGTLIIIGLARAPFVNKRLAGASLLPYLLAAILLPVGGVVFDFVVAHANR
jgi:hypothetical protein